MRRRTASEAPIVALTGEKQGRNGTIRGFPPRQKLHFPANPMFPSSQTIQEFDADLWQAMQSAYAGQHMSQVKPTSTRGGKVTADV